jgi:NAD(P)H-nitrite reductase large subunit
VGETKTIRAEIKDREWVEFAFQIDASGVITTCVWKSNGCAQILKASQQLQKQAQNKKITELKWQGKNHADLLLQEIIMKLNGVFKIPYTDEELCHCRKIPTINVDRAIVLGAHTPDQVKSWTTASSGCGTCRPDIESIINFRLKTTT